MIEFKSISAAALSTFTFVPLPHKHSHSLRYTFAPGGSDSIEILESSDLSSNSADFAGFFEYLMFDAESDLLGTRVIGALYPECLPLYRQ